MKKGVGVRELRQNLSKYLSVVERGTSLPVLDRGRPVAILVPLGEGATALNRLVGDRRALPARLDVLSLGPPPTLSGGRTISEALQAERDEA